MNKKNKILLGIALTSGVVASFSSAYALYVNATNGSEFSIGIGSVASHTDSSDTVTYKFGAIKTYSDESLGDDKELGNTKLSPDQNKVYIKVPLSFEYGETKTTSPQNSALGRFSVTVDIKNKLAAKGAKVSAQLKGYKDGTYFAAHRMSDFFETTYSSTSNDTQTIGESYTSVTKYIDTAVDASSIYCVITIDFSGVFTETNFPDWAEITNAYKVTLNWGDAYDDNNADESGVKKVYSDFESILKPTAYVRGDLSDWKDLADYQMVPNINATGSTEKVEWEYRLLKGFSKIKIFDSSETVLNDNGWIYCRGVEADSGAAVADGNATLDKDKNYHIYYTRDETYSSDNNKQGFYVGLEETKSE